MGKNTDYYHLYKKQKEANEQLLRAAVVVKNHNEALIGSIKALKSLLDKAGIKYD